MDTAVDTPRPHGGWLPRLLWRAMFVLGAAVVGTAVGWLLCTASACAATVPPDTVPPVGSVIGSVTSGLATPAVPPVAVVPGDLGDAVGQLGAHLTGRPTTVSAPAAQSPVSAPAPAPGGRSDDRTAPTPHRGAPATATRSHRTVPTGAVRSPITYPAAGAPHSDTAVAARHPMPAPLAPVGSGVGGTSGGVGTAGGIGPADASGALPLPVSNPAPVAPTSAPLGRGAAGKQPGTTPD